MNTLPKDVDKRKIMMVVKAQKDFRDCYRVYINKLKASAHYVDEPNNELKKLCDEAENQLLNPLKPFDDIYQKKLAIETRYNLTLIGGINVKPLRNAIDYHRQNIHELIHKQFDHDAYVQSVREQSKHLANGFIYFALIFAVGVISGYIFPVSFVFSLITAIIVLSMSLSAHFKAVPHDMSLLNYGVTEKLFKSCVDEVENKAVVPPPAAGSASAESKKGAIPSLLDSKFQN